MRPRARFAAWLYTGPLGHLYAGAADVAELAVRFGWLALSRRARRSATGRARP